MIAITKYDAQITGDRSDVWGTGRSMIGPREPVATINLTVVASGADLDKFMKMLEAVTGQARPNPGSDADELPALGAGMSRR